eukprot:gb/GECG01002246.1/.p1 GENE.gb/GECG01002246.1/~~gb/GECG01002246.1/.p1  ORF type:complete len:156 (+),score=17.00 gb/GECG01002246.1/:1-468(+)
MVTLYSMAATEFVSALETYPTKHWCRENLMDYLPGKKLPDEFTYFVNTMQYIMPPQDFQRAQCSEMNEREKKLCFFGSKVWEAYLRAKGEVSTGNTDCDDGSSMHYSSLYLAPQVNNRMNIHWKQCTLDKSVNSIGAVFPPHQTASVEAQSVCKN